MKVLIADFDLFNKIGGGQTFYRSIIEKNPAIDFYYFIITENPKASRPKNAHIMQYKEIYKEKYLTDFYDIDPPQSIHSKFIKASNIAASISGKDFDILDLPDYELFGIFLRPALKYHKAKVGKIALSLHGRLSTTIRLNWSTEGIVNKELELNENNQFRSVDIRYGISKAYIDEWSNYINLPTHYMNPLRFMTLPKPIISPLTDKPPDLNFIGRTEKRKGPDIFVELVWWLPRSRYKRANIIGPSSYDPKGTDSGHYLYTMKNNRINDIQILPSMNQKQLSRLFASKSITMLPSRYDSLNLIAIESLLSGCPTAVGSGAGVCRFLKESFPNVPFILIDVNNVYGSLDELQDILSDYDTYRTKLVNSIISCKPIIDGDPLEKIYISKPSFDHTTRIEMDEWYTKLIKIYNLAKRSPRKRTKDIAVKIIKSQIKPCIYQKLINLSSSLRSLNLRYTLKKLISIVNPNYLRVAGQIADARLLVKLYKEIFYFPEQEKKHLVEKIEKCWEVANGFRIDRIRIWREIARLEKLRENHLIAATYELRAMRLIGYDSFRMLGYVKAVLEKYGFNQEAIAADAMYAKRTDSGKICTELLEKAFEKNKTLPPLEKLEFIDDRRKSSTYRVSIIVSLYKSSAKLPFFLNALKYQTMLKSKQAELILIDSSSPIDDYQVFKNCLQSIDIDVVYARSKERETIQSAWNRGILLSRAPYLTFLGVDESILPDCLEILARELDTDQGIDWVQANSLVTNVDKNGQWLNDIMIYDRTGYKQDMAYLETCYLSWVAALYRKSIHEKFGYYDVSFKAAGDTEFKNRVLPFIKSKAITKTLGIFWNYPDDRTTQSPTAEIEDIRAWYIHRTIGGIRYAFARRNHKEAEDLFYTALCYRKSYCQHLSSDVEYAYNIGTFVLERIPDSNILPYLKGVKSLLDAYRSLEYIQKLTSMGIRYQLHKTYINAQKIEKEHQQLNHTRPTYQIFNDNRHEQHSFLWKSDMI